MNPHEAQARARKVARILAVLDRAAREAQVKIEPVDADAISDEMIARCALLAGVHPPSDKTRAAVRDAIRRQG